MEALGLVCGAGPNPPRAGGHHLYRWQLNATPADRVEPKQCTGAVPLPCGSSWCHIVTPSWPPENPWPRPNWGPRPTVLQTPTYTQSHLTLAPLAFSGISLLTRVSEQPVQVTVVYSSLTSPCHCSQSQWTACPGYCGLLVFDVFDIPLPL